MDLDAPRRLSLTRLVGEVARQLANIGSITVEGEVHQAKVYGGGRIYFTLKDRTAQLSVVVPAGRKQWARVRDGERVAVTGKLMMLADRGQLQFEAREVTPVGEGAIAQALADIRERMRADGLLDRPRRIIPRLPACVGVVCGNDAAVRKDIESVIAVRFPGYPVRFQEVTVQGPGAPEQIIRAMRLLCEDSAVEVIVLARGGGDAAQLLAFSDESLCRAVAACSVVVVSAIGHDGDRPLTDEVADVRAGTPSIAAALVVPHRGELLAEITGLHQHVVQQFGRRSERSTSRLASLDEVWRYAPQRRMAAADMRLAGVPWRHAIDRRVGSAQQRLTASPWQYALDRRVGSAAARLAAVDHRAALTGRVERHHIQLRGLHAQVEALSPNRVLARGFSIVTTSEGAVVRSSAQVRTGDLLTVTLAAGTVMVEARSSSPSPVSNNPVSNNPVSNNPVSNNP